MSAPIDDLRSDLLSDNWYVLKNWRFRYRRQDGQQVDMKREVFDRGNGAAILLYNRERQSVVLTRQFRLPAYLNGVEDGFLIEVAAGLLDEDSPHEAIKREAEEETGFQIGSPHYLYDLFMSPGAVTERVHFFTAEVTERSRTGPGGGLADENEDIEVIEISFSAAVQMVSDGRIRDAKTVLLLLHAQVNGLLD